MENMIEAMERHIVRIAIEKEADVKGSGTIFVGDSNQKAYIITAAHVIETIWGDKLAEKKRLHISCCDKDGNWKVIKTTGMISIQENHQIESECETWVYIHSKYNKETLQYDVAVICVPWQEWMLGLGSFSIEDCHTGEKLKVWGFPEAANKEWKPDTDMELAGKCHLEGSVNNSVGEWYSMSYHKEVLGRSADRDNAMVGFSGGAIFTEREEGPIFVGIVSKPYGDKMTGNMLRAVSGHLVLELIKEVGVQFSLPESFENHKNHIAGQFPPIRNAAKKFFVERVDELIDDKGLSPCMVVGENSYFERVKCMGDRKQCMDFWEGQLKKVVLLSLENVDVVQMANPFIEIEASEGVESVSVAYVCTEERVYDVLGSLLRQDYFLDTTVLSDKTVLLYNSRNTEDLSEYITRKECRGIVVDIVEKLSRRELKRVAGLSDEDGFNIIYGRPQQCNLAVAGIKKLMQVIDMGEGKIQKMQAGLREELNKLWEV